MNNKQLIESLDITVANLKATNEAGFKDEMRTRMDKTKKNLAWQKYKLKNKARVLKNKTVKAVDDAGKAIKTGGKAVAGKWNALPKAGKVAAISAAGLAGGAAALAARRKKAKNEALNYYYEEEQKKNSKAGTIAKGAAAGGAGYLVGKAAGYYSGLRNTPSHINDARNHLAKFSASKVVKALKDAKDEARAGIGLYKTHTKNFAPSIVRNGKIGGALGAAAGVGLYAKHKMNQAKKAQNESFNEDFDPSRFSN